MNKKQALQNAIEIGNKYGYISWDGLLDLCDEDMIIGKYLISNNTANHLRGRFIEAYQTNSLS